ncbi:MAG: TPR repeat protein [Candidatus Azotimanducaceae bacterium]|jgi:TPR repeat protein
MFRPLTLIVALSLVPVAGFSQSLPLQLEFLPPTLAPRDVCNVPRTDVGPDDLSIEGEGEDEALTDLDRIRYLQRDIRNHMNKDADGFFDFITALIAKRAAIDETFTQVDATFARIALMLRAGRINALISEGLIDGLRDRVADMTNEQRVTLAVLYADGTGVAADLTFSQDLIREAAYGGNALALLEIARLSGQGVLIAGWDAPLDLTITMAFGGILGGLDRGVCGRAERIAEEFKNGDLVAANPAVALAWYKFAADMGGIDAAWRIIEFHLNADAAAKDNIELRRYLRQAVRLGATVDEAANASLIASGAVTEKELSTILGFNYSQDARRTSAAIAPLLNLVINIDGLEADEDGLFLDYLWEISQMPEAPGRVFSQLANEILTRKGRWAGEAEALPLLEQAALRGDGQGQRSLANRLVRYRDNPAQIARAESLLMEVVSRHGMPEGMDDLDILYRCQVNDAPRLVQADPWAAAYRASGHATLPISANDLLALSPDRSPEAIAKIQSLALDHRSQMVAAQAQRVQSNPLASASALQYWAKAVNGSPQALEAFAELEFELSATPDERDLAIELFRRVYLNNGVTTALDLAIALVEYNGRDPDVAKEIAHLLTMAGNRGEGGAIRLLSRLQADSRPESAVFAQFSDKIEARGDFLALMFAVPHIQQDQVDDYIDRAVSLMSCGTKDADELGAAYAIRQDSNMSYHWRNILLHFEGGHVLSKLRLTDRQVQWFDDGTAPDPVDRATRALAQGDTNALMQLVNLTANSDLPTYDAQAAVGHIVATFERGAILDLVALAAIYRTTTDEIRLAVDAKINFDDLLLRVAQTGDVSATYALAMRLRDSASNPEGLSQSLVLLEAAASRGHRDAMYQTGYALGFGLGRAANAEGAVDWLEKAASQGHPEAAALAQALRIAEGL